MQPQRYEKSARHREQVQDGTVARKLNIPPRYSARDRHTPPPQDLTKSEGEPRRSHTKSNMIIPITQNIHFPQAGRLANSDIKFERKNNFDFDDKM